jgi:hypothetical protein
MEECGRRWMGIEGHRGTSKDSRVRKGERGESKQSREGEEECGTWRVMGRRFGGQHALGLDLESRATSLELPGLESARPAASTASAGPPRSSGSPASGRSAATARSAGTAGRPACEGVSEGAWRGRLPGGGPAQPFPGHSRRVGALAAGLPGLPVPPFRPGPQRPPPGPSLPARPHARMPFCPQARRPACPHARMPACPPVPMLACSHARPRVIPPRILKPPPVPLSAECRMANAQC